MHGSRTHHGTYYAPSTVLKTEGLTGAPALSSACANEFADECTEKLVALASVVPSDRAAHSFVFL